MQILVKTLLGKQFKRDLDPTMTVQEFKERIEKDEGKDYPVDQQKLIYEGKILSNSSKLSEYNIDHKKFIVLLIARPPPSTKKETEPSPSQQPQPRTQPPAQPRPQQPAQPTVSAQPTRPENQLADRLASITSRPHFITLQQTIQQNPHSLSSTIESLASTDPELYGFITENPDLFLNALNAKPPTGSRVPTSGLRGQTSSASRPVAVGGQGSPMNHMLASATDQDRQAIERLKELGFTEFQVVQAYMACDKDEQLAANLLFQMDQ